MRTRHSTSSTMNNEAIAQTGAPETPEQARDESSGAALLDETEKPVIWNLGGLDLKLRELGKEKSQLDMRRNRIDEDIQALKRAMQLVVA